MKTISYLALVVVVLVATILPLGAPLAKAQGPERYGANLILTVVSREMLERERFQPGDVITLIVDINNTGNFTWNAHDHRHPYHIHLSYHWYDDQTNLIQWDGLRSHLAEDVPPNGWANSAKMTVKVPQVSFQPGEEVKTLSLRLDLVREGVTWFSWVGVPTSNYWVRVEPSGAGAYSAIYTDHNSTPSIMAAGSKARFTFAVVNKGSATWNRGGSNPVHTSYHWYDSRGKVVVWDGLRTKLPKDVAPGKGSGTFTITIKAPPTPGTYFIKYDMVKEGVTWFSWVGSPMHVRQVVVR